MLNYFKIFRVRKFAVEPKQERDERFVFFDDSGSSEVEKAAELARNHRANLEKKYSAVRVSLYRSIRGVDAYLIGVSETAS